MVSVRPAAHLLGTGPGFHQGPIQSTPIRCSPANKLARSGGLETNKLSCSITGPAEDRILGHEARFVSFRRLLLPRNLLNFALCLRSLYERHSFLVIPTGVAGILLIVRLEVAVTSNGALPAVSSWFMICR